MLADKSSTIVARLVGPQSIDSTIRSFNFSGISISFRKQEQPPGMIPSDLPTYLSTAKIKTLYQSLQITLFNLSTYYFFFPTHKSFQSTFYNLMI